MNKNMFVLLLGIMTSALMGYCAKAFSLQEDNSMSHDDTQTTAPQWRAVCQMTASHNVCETKAGKKLFDYPAVKVALDELPQAVDYYGVNRAGAVYKTTIDGESVQYAYAEVSNGVTMVWSDSPLF